MKCSDEISIGEYVRTDKGIITKAQEHFIDGLLNGKSAFGKAVKHSKDIIDLIELGDYVNGYMVIDKFTDPFIKVKKIRVDFINKNWQGDCSDETYSNDEIETIITKEQIKQIEYRIGERIN